MARDRSPIVKQSRREGVALHPKAHKILVRNPAARKAEGAPHVWPTGEAVC